MGLLVLIPGYHIDYMLLSFAVWGIYPQGPLTPLYNYCSPDRTFSRCRSIVSLLSCLSVGIISPSRGYSVITSLLFATVT